MNGWLISSYDMKLDFSKQEGLDEEDYESTTCYLISLVKCEKTGRFGRQRIYNILFFKNTDR